MLLRLPLAFALGLTLYLIAMALTTYDGLLSLLLQPLIGSLLTAVALAALSLLGSPLLLPRIWPTWRRLRWLPLLLTAAGLASLLASWHPALRIKVLNPETHAMTDSFHPALATTGWLASMFGIAFCPTLGLRGDRRWL